MLSSVLSVLKFFAHQNNSHSKCRILRLKLIKSFLVCDIKQWLTGKPLADLLKAVIAQLEQLQLHICPCSLLEGDPSREALKGKLSKNKNFSFLNIF